MPVFIWEGTTRKDEVKKGEMEAVDEPTARGLLRRQGFKSIEIRKKPKDILEYGDLTEEDKKIYRHTLAIEFSPMYTLADYPVKIGNKLCITDYNVRPVENIDSTVDFKPSITLVELLYAIFWELFFCGDIDHRDDMLESINDSVKRVMRRQKRMAL